MSEACQNCKFWKLVSEQLGWCRRLPPRIIESLASKVDADEPWENENIWMMSCFPATGEEDWCGEWSPASRAIGS